ncbi:MAG TPA: helix-turn-helix transcriptional regulator [Longimicrobiales bacterium]|nr:helix-turn-helix transcriptional regulator [Longimicrobiales bacterium]
MGEVLGGFEHRVLLALMRLGERSYSVPVVQELERLQDRTVAPSAVYLTLRRLEKRGLVTSEMEPPAEGEGGRERRVFHITPAAVEVLRSARAEFARLWDGVEALEP